MRSTDNMVVFAAVVESGGFSAAANKLGISTPVVSKRVSALEADLGARLLNRSTRSLHLTEAGRVYYQYCARVVTEVEEAESAVTFLNAAPRGLLRITAPLTLGSQHIARALAGFIDRYPEVEVELDLSDRQVNLSEEAFDLAIRITTNPPPNLSARRLATSQRVICAAPDYWRRRGMPSEPGELVDHNCILFGNIPDFNVWHFSRPDSSQSVAVRGNFKVNSVAAMAEAAIGGLGVVRLTSFVVDRAIAAGELQVALAEYASPATDIYALYLPNRYLSAKTRAFIDYLINWNENNSL